MTLLAEIPRQISAPMSRVADMFGRLWVAQTISTREKTLARHMTEFGVGHFLPQERLREFIGGRFRTVYRPIFPGYLFFAGDYDTRIWVASNEYTTRTLHIRDEDQEQLRADLIELEAELDAGIVRSACHIHAGSQCEVRNGHPMRGTRVRINKLLGNGRASATNLQNGFPLEIDQQDLDAMD